MEQQQPTREEFDAAAKKVAASAPTGLSREAFYALVEKELQGPTPIPGFTVPRTKEGPTDRADQILAAQARGTQATGERSPREPEPDTWWGGFLRKLKDEWVTPHVAEAIGSAAESPTTGLLAPVDFTRSITGSIANQLPATLKQTAAEKPGGTDMLSVLQHKASFPLRAMRNFNESMPSEMAKRVEEFRGPKLPSPAPTQPTPITGQDSLERALSQSREVNPNDAPLWQQQTDLQSGSVHGVTPTGRTGTPPYQTKFQPVTPTSPRPAQGGGTAAPTLEDEMANMLAMEKGRLSPSKFSLPNEPTITPSGIEGDAFSSGRPSITEQNYQELFDNARRRYGPPKPPGGTPPQTPPPQGPVTEGEIIPDEPLGLESPMSEYGPNEGEWHSGESGTPEAKRASMEHRANADLDSLYRNHITEDLIPSQRLQGKDTLLSLVARALQEAMKNPGK